MTLDKLNQYIVLFGPKVGYGKEGDTSSPSRRRGFKHHEFIINCLDACIIHDIFHYVVGEKTTYFLRLPQCYFNKSEYFSLHSGGKK